MDRLVFNKNIKQNLLILIFLASIPTLVMLPVVLSAGWMLGLFGRRLSVIMVFITTLLAWLTTYFANSYETLFASRFIAGIFVGGAYPVVVTYMGETTHPRIRAVCLAGVPLGCAVGVLLTQFLGIYLHWRKVALILATFPIYNLLICSYIKESYIWLLNKNRVDEARRAFVWFRGIDIDAKAEFMAALDSKDNVVAINSSIKEKIKFCFSKAFVMPFLLTALLFLTSEFSGDTALIFYTSHIIKIITNDPEAQYYSNLILNILRVIATIASAMLIKRFSIRTVFIATGFCLACSLANISLFLYLSGAYPENKAFPLICLVSVIVNVIFFALGLGPLPTVICGEMYPASVRDIGGALSAFLSFTSLFTIVKLMPHFFVLVNPEFIFLMFACCTLTGVTVMCFVLPNTKNKTLKELENFYEA